MTPPTSGAILMSGAMVGPEPCLSGQCRAPISCGDVASVMVTGITYMFPAFKWGDLRRAAALLAALTQEKT